MDSLETLDKCLDDLEGVLTPLLSKSLPETLDRLDVLQKAKLQVLLPYVVNDLVFIYLKTRGINPKTHPVVGELDRIKQYFDKIKNAEDPEKRRFAVDQGAATRFIKHAIKESQEIQEQSQHGIKQGTHTRFTETNAVEVSGKATVVMSNATTAALAKIQEREAALQRQSSSSEESELEVFAGPTVPKSIKQMINTNEETGRAKDLEVSPRYKRRRAMDPWAGYDESTLRAPSPKDKPADKRRRQRQ